MKSMMKALTCGVAATLMLVSAAAPADARHRHRDRDNLDAGDVIGAAIVLGGLAAIFSATKDRGYGGDYGAERKAVNACVREAERGGSRYNAARVSDVTDVQRRDGYYFVTGMLETRVRSVYPGGPDPVDDYVVPAGAEEGFSCTVRGSRIYDFQRSGGYHW